MKKSVLLISVMGVLSVILLAGPFSYQWRGWVFHLTCATKRSCIKEKKTFELLKGLITQFNVTPWVRTRVIHLQDGVASRSTPLTINTQKNNDRLCLLSIFLHEQIHKLQSAYPGRFSKAMDAMKKMFPDLPSNLSGDPNKAYRHFIVIFFEFEALERLLGTAQAKSVLRRKPLYSWIQERIFENRAKLKSIYTKCGLGYNY